MRRNGDKVRNKRGNKYSLDRSKWSTYRNFLDLYNRTIKEMEIAGVVRRHEEPALMDQNGIVMSEEDAFGCNVIHDLIHPEMCVVGDEVG